MSTDRLADFDWYLVVCKNHDIDSSSLDTRYMWRSDGRTAQSIPYGDSYLPPQADSPSSPINHENTGYIIQQA